MFTLDCPGLQAQQDGNQPEITIKDTTTDQTYDSYNALDLTLIQNGAASFLEACTQQQILASSVSQEISYDATTNGTSQGINLVNVDLDNFSGVYNPSLTTLSEIMGSMLKVGSRKKRQVSQNLGFLDGTDQFLNQPVVCSTINSVFMWSLESGAYPKFDENNLFNENTENFDWGAFRILESEMLDLNSASPTIFSFTFTTPGVFSFFLENSNFPDRYIYIRIMGVGSDCQETGPYFPPTEINFSKNGVSVETNILQKPDWAVLGWVFGVCIACILISVTSLCMLREYGWDVSHLDSKEVGYRKKALEYDFSKFASKNQVVKIKRKLHPGGRAGLEKIANMGDLLDMDEFWDYQKQAEIEGITSEKVYDMLRDKATSVNSLIQTDQQKANKLYQKVIENSSEVKDSFNQKLGLDDNIKIKDETTKKRLIKTKTFSEETVQKRKNLAKIAGDFYERLIDLRMDKLQKVFEYFSKQSSRAQEAVGLLEILEKEQGNGPGSSETAIFDRKFEQLDKIRSDFANMLQQAKSSINQTIVKQEFVDFSKESNPKIVSTVENQKSLTFINKSHALDIPVQKIRQNSSMVCPETGLTCKILSTTLDKNNKIIPVGGTIDSVFTGMKCPIEIGGLFSDNDEIFPISGIQIENNKVSPVFVKSGLVPEHFPDSVVETALLDSVYGLQTQLLLQLNASSNLVGNGSELGHELKDLAGKMSLAVTERFL